MRLITLLGIVALFVFFFFLFLLEQVENLLGDFNNIVEGLGGSTCVDENHFLTGERNVHHGMNTKFEVKIDAVENRKIVNVLTSNLEEIVSSVLSVCICEVPLESGELVFDHAFDASIFDHVQNNVTHGSVRSLTNKITPSIGGGPQCVGDLMTDQMIVNAIGHVLPNGQSKNTILNVERCGLGSSIMTYGNVLFRHATGEHVFLGCSGLVRYARIGNLHTPILVIAGELQGKS